MPTRAEVSKTVGYDTTVDDWHASIADVYESLLNDELQDGQCGAFLVWGDPSLYDSVLRILDRLQIDPAIARGLEWLENNQDPDEFYNDSLSGI